MKPLCIYHGNCADGFTSAWVVRKALGEVDFHAGVYQNPPPDMEGRDVFLVDFSYKRAALEEMGSKARSITILDHHKTAAEDLSGFPRPVDWHTAGGMIYPGITALFDMNRSGAGITWDYFYPGKPRPMMLNHVEDRDLWRFALRKTREIQASVFSYPYDFKAWDFLMTADPEQLAVEGEAIERKHFKDIRELVTVVTREFTIAGHTVPIDKWILMLLKAILGEHAQVRNLGDVRWLATEDGSVGKGTGRHIAAFILNGSDRRATE